MKALRTDFISFLSNSSAFVLYILLYQSKPPSGAFQHSLSGCHEKLKLFAAHLLRLLFLPSSDLRFETPEATVIKSLHNNRSSHYCRQILICCAATLIGEGIAKGVGKAGS
jgi:hypothetical protein